MTTKQDVNDKLKPVLGSDEFVNLWWQLPILGLGKAKPNDIWERDPQRIADYVDNYIVGVG